MIKMYGPHLCIIWSPTGYRLVTWEHTKWDDNAGVLINVDASGKLAWRTSGELLLEVVAQ